MYLKIYILLGVMALPLTIYSCIDTYLQQLTQQNRFSGTVLVARHNKIMLNKGYNLANRELYIPNSSATKFRIASITKLFTAIAVLKLQEMEKLSINNPLTYYIADYPRGASITIHQLLTHTSGIFNISAIEHFEEYKKLPTTLEKSIAYFKQLPLLFEPGTKHEYSNSNYILLTYIIEKVSGSTYQDFIYKYILAPLNMTNTGYDYNHTILENRAQGYTFLNNTLTYGDYIDMTWAAGSGGLYSTVEDLYKLDQALYSNKLLTSQSEDLLFKYHTPGYGYGCELGALFNQKYTAHPGAIYGFSSKMVRFIESNTTIIVLSNYEHCFPLDPIIEHVASLIFT